MSANTPIALVTGATRGLGRAIAVELARRNIHVIAQGRSVGALEALDDLVRAIGAQATLAPFDLRTEGSIEALAGDVASRWGRLDILVGNAGVLGGLSPVPDIQAKAWTEAFAVNVTANFRLIRAFDPLLRQSRAGRAVFVTSSAATEGRAYWGLYSASKAALNALVQAYAQETLATGLRVNLVSPGPLRTEMRSQAMPGEDGNSLRSPDVIAPMIADLLSPAETRTGALIDLRHCGV